MAAGPKNGVAQLLVTLLQERRLPWATLSLVESTITLHARASRYSAYAKENWSDDQWMSFLEEGEAVRDACAACVTAFRYTSDVTAFNASLDTILERVAAMDGAIRERPDVTVTEHERGPVELPLRPEAGGMPGCCECSSAGAGRIRRRARS